MKFLLICKQVSQNNFYSQNTKMKLSWHSIFICVCMYVCMYVYAWTQHWYIRPYKHAGREVHKYRHEYMQRYNIAKEKLCHTQWNVWAWNLLFKYTIIYIYIYIYIYICSFVGLVLHHMTPHITASVLYS